MTPVCEKVSRSSGTIGGACRTRLVCPGPCVTISCARVLIPMLSGARMSPWKSNRHSSSLSERWPKEGVVPPGSAAICGAAGSSPNDGSGASSPGAVLDVALASSAHAGAAPPALPTTISATAARIVLPRHLTRFLIVSPPDVHVERNQLIVETPVGRHEGAGIGVGVGSVQPPGIEQRQGFARGPVGVEHDPRGEHPEVLVVFLVGGDDAV